MTEVGASYGRLICGWLGVVDTASLLPAAGALQAGLAAAVGVTPTGEHGLYRSSIIYRHKSHTMFTRCYRRGDRSRAATIASYPADVGRTIDKRCLNVAG